MSQRVLSLPRRRPSVVVRMLPSGRSLLIGFALLLAAGGLYALARGTSMFAIRHVAVQGADPGVRTEAAAAVRSFDGTSLLALNGAAVIRKLEALPTIVSASYDRDFPHTLRLRVVPEVPVAVLRSGHQSWLVSARGRVIAAIDRTRFRFLPRIWVAPGANAQPGAFLSDDAGAAARALRDFVAARFASRVLWARMQSGQLTLALRSGLEVRLGPPTETSLKLAIVGRILPTLALPAAGGSAYLDVSVPERPVAGVNPQPAG